MWVPCGTVVAFSVNLPCSPKKKILRSFYCMAVCQISSFVSEACGAASAPRALSAFAKLMADGGSGRPLGRSGSISFHVAALVGAHVESDSLDSIPYLPKDTCRSARW